MSEITFHCPHCKKFLKATVDLAGETIKCTGCSKTIQIPSPSAESSENSSVNNGRSCRGCGATIAPAAIVCMHCGMNQATGHKYGTKATSAPSKGIPTVIKTIALIATLGIAVGGLVYIHNEKVKRENEERMAQEAAIKAQAQLASKAEAQRHIGSIKGRVHVVVNGFDIPLVAHTGTPVYLIPFSDQFRKEYSILAAEANPLLHLRATQSPFTVPWAKTTEDIITVEQCRVELFRRCCSQTAYADKDGKFAFTNQPPGKYLVLIEGCMDNDMDSRITIWTDVVNLKGGDTASLDFGESNVGETERIYAFADVTSTTNSPQGHAAAKAQPGQTTTANVDEPPNQSKEEAAARSLCRQLSSSPGSQTLLAQMRTMAGQTTNAELRCRMSMIYYLGCLETKQTNNSSAAWAYLTQNFSADPFVWKIAPAALNGSCDVCNGTGSHLATCPKCGGGLHCPCCGGKGVVAAPNHSSGGICRIGETPSNVKTIQVRCAMCGGSGKCPVCDGTGKVSQPCSACGGTGTKLSYAKIHGAYTALLSGRYFNTSKVPDDTSDKFVEVFSIDDEWVLEVMMPGMPGGFGAGEYEKIIAYPHSVIKARGTKEHCDEVNMSEYGGRGHVHLAHGNRQRSSSTATQTKSTASPRPTGGYFNAGEFSKIMGD